MYRRLDYALNMAVESFRRKSLYIIVVYPLLAISGAMFSVHSIVYHLSDNILLSAFIGWIAGTILGAMPIGFFLLVLLLSTFVYGLTVGPDPGVGARELIRLRGVRIAASMVLSTIISFSVLVILHHGIRQLPVVGEQYDILLNWSKDKQN
jgi:hypothetical protein